MEATVEVSPALPSPPVPSGTRGARPGPMARHERLEEDVNRTEEAELQRMETNAEMEMMETDATAGDAEGEGCQGAAEAEEEVEEVCGGEQGEERDQGEEGEGSWLPAGTPPATPLSFDAATPEGSAAADASCLRGTSSG